jgi:hypothetical protein
VLSLVGRLSFEKVEPLLTLHEQTEGVRFDQTFDCAGKPQWAAAPKRTTAPPVRLLTALSGDQGTGFAPVLTYDSGWNGRSSLWFGQALRGPLIGLVEDNTQAFLCRRVWRPFYF